MGAADTNKTKENAMGVDCPCCDKGVMLPLSDFDQGGASVQYKAWACSSPTCGHELRIDKGATRYARVGDSKPGAVGQVGGQRR